MKILAFHKNLTSTFILLTIFSFILLSCNEKSDDDEAEIAVTSSTVAVKNFNLRADSKVMSHLDSVYFSIDLDHGVIYNADSLPKGTNVTRLIPVITFANTMSAVELSFLKDNVNDTTVNFLTNPNDSIDFTHPVSMKVTAADGVSKFEYILKVNVHKENPDTLIWDRSATAKFPSRTGTPVKQKSILTSETGDITTLIEEADGSYTLAVTDNIETGQWDIREIQTPAALDVETLSFTGEEFLVLGDSGDPYITTDFTQWAILPAKWINVIGRYNNCVIGMNEVAGELRFCHYPATEDIADLPVPADFPVSGFSNPGMIYSQWSPYPIMLLAGGVTRDDKLSDKIWGFDGTTWDTLAQSEVLGLQHPALVKYVVYREMGSAFSTRAFDAWLLFGGLTEGGNVNDVLYISLDNGISWKAAPDLMQLPESFPVFSRADCFVIKSELKADLTDIWTTRPNTNLKQGMRVAYEVDGYDLYWECPYIYVLGALTSDGRISDAIWRGVLARLEFVPII